MLRIVRFSDTDRNWIGAVDFSDCHYDWDSLLLIYPDELTLFNLSSLMARYYLLLSKSVFSVCLFVCIFNGIVLIVFFNGCHDLFIFFPLFLFMIFFKQKTFNQTTVYLFIQMTAFIQTHSSKCLQVRCIITSIILFQFNFLL